MSNKQIIINHILNYQIKDSIIKSLTEKLTEEQRLSKKSLGDLISEYCYSSNCEFFLIPYNIVNHNYYFTISEEFKKFIEEHKYICSFNDLTKNNLIKILPLCLVSINRPTYFSIILVKDIINTKHFDMFCEIMEHYLF